MECPRCTLLSPPGTLWVWFIYFSQDMPVRLALTWVLIALVAGNREFWFSWRFTGNGGPRNKNDPKGFSPMFPLFSLSPCYGEWVSIRVFRAGNIGGLN